MTESTFNGMSPAAVKNSGQSLTDAAQSIGQALESAIDAMEAIEWIGEDREHFITTYCVPLSEELTLVEELRTLGQHLVTEADQQLTASAA